MSYFPQDWTTSSSSPPVTETPPQYLTVRLTDGSRFYEAGGLTASVGNVSQGDPNLLSEGWPVKITDGNNVLGVQVDPLWVTGSIFVLNPSGGSSGGFVAVTSSVALDVTASIPGQVNVQGNVTASVNGTVSVSNFPAGFNNTLVSGSITGLLVGGQPISAGNPLPVSLVSSVSVDVTASVTFPAVQNVSGSNWIPTITGSVSLSAPVAVSNFPTTQNVTGSVTLAAAPQVNQGTNPWIVTGSVGLTTGVSVLGQVNVQGNVTASVNGSVTALQGAPNSLANAWPVILSSGSEPIGVSGTPLYMTGSVGLSSPIAVGNFPAGFNNTLLSGSITGLLVGGQPINGANPIPVSSSIAFPAIQTVTGSISLSAPIAISNFPTTQNVTGSNWTPTITGSVSLSAPVAVSNFPAGFNNTLISGSITGLLVGGQPVSSVNPIPVSSSIAFPSVQIVSGSSWTPTITGSVIVSNQVSALVVSGSVIGLLMGGSPINSGNPVPILISSSSLPAYVGPASSVISAVTASSTAEILLRSNVSRADLSIFNNSSLSLYISFGAAVSTSSFTALIPSSSLFEAQYPAYTGIVTGIWPNFSSGPDAAMITELSSTGSLMVGIGGGGQTTTLSGSVSGLLLGGQPASSVNPLYVTGTLGIPTYSTDTETSLTASFSSSVVLYQNVDRLGASLMNNSLGQIYVKFGSPASSSSFKYLLPAAWTLEFPQPVYVGLVTAAWAGSGSVQISGSLMISEATQ